ncbi:hemin uptake protein HemP [Hyphomicrobium sp. NDB2Meth4]|uniref:hemin uptake protein HemP n=1 Tax=Hyphomicrobium sp. NDB2Meth4 TaxID=1892846 RepID=UPI000A980B83|nr:hemin uptake protein HemP [Hyphomicrobium sp. NDB2Meth4]
MTIEVKIAIAASSALDTQRACCTRKDGQNENYGAQVMTAAVDTRKDAHESEANSETQNKKVRVLVSEILQGGKEAILEHDGQDYRLRITANGKLILTK